MEYETGRKMKKISIFGFEIIFRKSDKEMICIPLKEYKSMKRQLRVASLRT